MIDIVSTGSDDIALYDTQAERAANILNVQLGSLEYLPTIGIDLKFFLSEDIRFQNESFKSYIIQTLALRSINVANLIEVIESLSATYLINIEAAETSTALITR